MASKPFKVIIGAVAVLALGGTIITVRLDTAHLRRQLSRLRTERQEAERVREDNRQLQEIVARVQADTAHGAGTVRADLERAKTEVEELERKARSSYAQLRTQAAQDEAKLDGNRDPESGLTRLEYFQNKGQATPAAAFQTFVWAAIKGEDTTLAGMIALDGAAREKAMALVASLPEETRTKYPTPEKLAALFFASALTGQTSAQVMEVSFSDARHATVHVRGLTDKAQKIPMQLGPQGWQIVAPVAVVEKLRAWALAEAPAPARK